MKRIILQTILICLLIFSLEPIITLINADEPNNIYTSEQSPIIQDVPGLRAEFKQYTQDPDSKIIKFEMILKSNIDSDRLKVTWSVNGQSYFPDKSQSTINAQIQKDKSYTIPINVGVLGYGLTEIIGTAQAFASDSSYLVTIRKDFASNDNGEVLPLSQEYNSAKTISLVKKVLEIILGLTLLIAIIFFLFKKFSKWLNKDEIKEFDKNI